MNKVDLNKIKLLVLDFDGVMTDNRVWVFEDGREAVVCNRGDGMGISLVKRAGLEVAVLSTETNPVVTARCKKLKIECLQGLDDKGEAFERFVKERGLDMSAVAYVGNDVNDLECLRLAGLSVVVADAHRVVIDEVDLVLVNKGGNGAVREICDILLKNLKVREKIDAKRN